MTGTVFSSPTPPGPGLLGTRYATSGRPEIVNALRDGVPDSRVGRSKTLDQEILATAVPVTAGGTTAAVVRITQGLGPLRAGARRATLGLVAIGAAGLLAGLLIAFVLAESLSRPLAKLSGIAHQFGRGRLSARVGPLRGPREAKDVGRASTTWRRVLKRPCEPQAHLPQTPRISSGLR